MGPPPAWQGFRSLRVSRKLHESSDVTSLVLEPADGQPLTAALAGQFIVLRLRPGPDESVLLRSYSLSGAPSEDRYRISELLPTILGDLKPVEPLPRLHRLARRRSTTLF